MEIKLKIDAGAKKSGDTVIPSAVVYTYPKPDKIDQFVVVDGIQVFKKDYDIVKE